MKVDLCVNRGDLHEKLIEKLTEALVKLAEKHDVELQVEVNDVGLYGEVDISNPAFVFGTFAKSQVNVTGATAYYLPDLECLEPKAGNKKTRKDTSEKLKEIVAEICSTKEEEKEVVVEQKVETKQETYAVAKDNFTVGKGDVDFEIPEDKIQYLKEIKDLLNCNRIIIEKNGVRIEFD